MVGGYLPPEAIRVLALNPRHGRAAVFARAR
jgi:hypothetical protein